MINLGILIKYGLGLAGLVGIGVGLGLGLGKPKDGGSFQVSEVKVEMTDKDKEGYFLYKLASKVYPYLKDKNKTGSDANLKNSEHIVDGLKKEFDLKDKVVENNGTSFKELCEAHIPEDEKVSNTYESYSGNKYTGKPAVRVCYIDTNASSVGKPKGQLRNGESEVSEVKKNGGSTTYKYSAKYSGFDSDSWGEGVKENTNRGLGDMFKARYENKSVIESFDEGGTIEDNSAFVKIKNTLESPVETNS